MPRVVVTTACVIVSLSFVTAPLAAKPAASVAPAPSAAEAAVRTALGQPTRLDFQEQPLGDVVDVLSHQHKLEIQLDNKALTDAGLGTDTPITMNLDGIRLRSALRLMLNELDLTYLVRDDYLLITSKTEAESMLKIKTYPVRDLVTLDNDFRPPLAPGEAVAEDYRALIELLTSAVAPTTWDEVGGPGSIKSFRNAHAISISQTELVHEEAAELMDTLRLVRDEQLAAAKALPPAGGAPQPENEELRTYIYRLPPWPRQMPWPSVSPTAGSGSIGGMGGGGGMGGAIYDLAAEGARADTKPAAPPAAAAPPASKPTQTPKQHADTTEKSARAATIEWDARQSDDWTRELAASLPTLVEPETWQPQGKGSIRLLTGALVIRQTPKTHQKIIRFFEELLPMRVVTSAPLTDLGARLPAPGPRPDWPQAAAPRSAGSEAKILAALDQKCDVDFRETPLSAAIQSLAAKGRIRVWFDHRALTDAGVGTDTPVTRSIHGITIRAAFKLLLSELDLTYVIRNEVLAITSKTEAESMLTTKVYPVFDLVSSAPGARPPHARTSFRQIGPVSGTAINGFVPSELSRAGFSDFQSLLDNISTNVAPTTWDEVGGPGVIRGFVNAGALVISQTTEVHEEIADYLSALREVAASQK